MLTLFRYPMNFSFSPLIHHAFARQIGVEVDYTQTEVAPNQLQAAVHQFKQNGGIGANVTMPLKEEAFQICDKLTERAQVAKSVNTLYWRDAELWGDNTDGIGFYRDITQNLNRTFTNKVVCILGAGGAARGIIADIAKDKPQAIFVLNRTFARAQDLTQHFRQHEIYIEAMTFEALNSFAKKNRIDWFIQARPSILSDDLALSKHLIAGASVYELSYAKNAELLPFNAWALENNAHEVFDGLGMLVEQAKEAFQSWFQCENLETTAILKNLRIKQKQPDCNYT